MRRQDKLKTCAGFVFVIIIIFSFCVFNYTDTRATDKYEALKYDRIELDNDSEIYPPFQPEVISDFPTVEGSKPRIPHILHQTYTGLLVPIQYTMFAERLAQMHPSWKYYFWTDDSARQLVKDRYPNLLKIWDDLELSIHRGDILRYIVLYEFGGVYLDMDVDTIKPLEPVTMKYACIIPPEPFEHNVFIYKTHIFMSNAIMFCRPKHPFFKLLLDNLQSMTFTNHAVMDTGPGLVTRTYLQYNNIDATDVNRTKTGSESNSPYFYKGELPETDDNAVYVPNTHYFSDVLDINLQEQNFKLICRKFEEQNYLTRKACKDMQRRGMTRKNTKFNILVHKWYHYWKFKQGDIKRLLKRDIREFVPNAIIY